MKNSLTKVMDGNEAAASVAYRCSEVVAIYPITPSSPMGESADEWAAGDHPNLWGSVPIVVEMQSEGGAAGAIHGAVQAGTLATTFTASQGLLLMVPNLFKIAGELTPMCMHVAARTLATHALSIFGDHSDVMAIRQTGVALLASSSVQESHDMALIGHAATLRSRIPFVHFFEGFRTSHELNRIDYLSDEELLAVLDESAIAAHRARALTPDRPVLRGSAQNPDTFFQAREACNPFYEACPAVVQEVMDTFADHVGRRYHLFDYTGHPEAERVIVIMGSGAETARETAQFLSNQGEKVGVVTVRLYRPFSVADFILSLPETTRAIAVLDRTKEPGGPGEPMYLDVVAALAQAQTSDRPRFATTPQVVGGRYGLSSKEFTPAQIKAVFDALNRERPGHDFTVGILDDVSNRSLEIGPPLEIDPPGTVRSIFFGLGADGTVGANKNSTKIIAEETGAYAQAYFVYDSRKSGSTTVSHLRSGPSPIRAPYLLDEADFVACHHFPLLRQMDILSYARPGATVLLNAAGTGEEVWSGMPGEAQKVAIDRNLSIFAIDASRLAKEVGLGRRINTVMQTCFFLLSKTLPRDTAIEKIKQALDRTYGRRSKEIVRRNFAAVDQAEPNLVEVPVPTAVTSAVSRPPAVSDTAPEFVRKVTAEMLLGRGDDLPVSAMPVDGTWPTGTCKYEKRAIAIEAPIFHAQLCIQCNKCALICPHGVIRIKVLPKEMLVGKPEKVQTLDYRGEEFEGQQYILGFSTEDCTGCTLCVEICPAKDKANPRRKSLEMKPLAEAREAWGDQFDWFLSLPETDRRQVPMTNIKHSQIYQPLFEFSGACAGCGETPYVKLITQLFGDRMMIANATGCSSIYGGNLPTTPFTTNADGRGPTWSNSLFEDNAEFGFGMRIAVEKLNVQAKEMLQGLASRLDGQLVHGLLGPVTTETEIFDQRERVEVLRRALEAPAFADDAMAQRLSKTADYLVPKSVWIVGGDGWAYDIGYGGLDHVLASDLNVNLLVLDTEVYSNTGGQQSKATPLGASAKFAIQGRAMAKKDLGMIAMAYGHVYVAQIAMGAKETQTVRALEEAESYDGPSLIIAYSHCVAHGYDLSQGLDQQKRAVNSGHWPLYRFDPRRLARNEKPLMLDSGPAKIRLADFMAEENRFHVVEYQNPQRFKELLAKAEEFNRLRYDRLKFLAGFQSNPEKEG